MALTDFEIKRLIATGDLVITDFVPELVREVDGKRVLSYGLGPAGYDVRLTGEWKVFKQDFKIDERVTWIHSFDLVESVAPENMALIIDPLAFDEEILANVKTNEFILWPGQYALAATKETFKIPTNLVGTFYAKSSYARSGLILNTTNVQPGFEGQIVMEFHNPSPRPILIRADHGFAEIKLHYTTGTVDQSYADVGKYQNQTGVQVPKA